MTTDETPRDGERLGVFEFMSLDWPGWGFWVYTAGYADKALCKRRARSLTAGLGVDVWVYGPMDATYAGGRYAGDYIAYVPERHTAALRAALTPTPTTWPDDTAAHVRETVDELRRDGAGGGDGDER